MFDLFDYRFMLSQHLVNHYATGILAYLADIFAETERLFCNNGNRLDKMATN